MDRFIDEQDSSRDRSSSPNFYSLMFGSSGDGRKGLSLYPGAKSQLHMAGENNGASDLSSAAASTNPPTSSVAPALGSQTAQLASESGNTNGRLQVLADNASTNPSSQPKSP